MKVKRLAALALAAAMTLSLTACGKKTGDDWETIEKSGELKIGFTYFEPMNYLDDAGEFVGFETEFAQAVCDKLGLKPNFVEINWDAKTMELESGKIDCIWNGMTITPELSEALTISEPYIKNYQVVVIRSADADKYKTTADLSSAKLDAEAGSAGESAVQDDADLSKAAYTAVTKQTDALLEVKSGQADAAVMDFVLANALAGKGDYSDLMVIPDLQLSVEEYGIGFRKGSAAADKVNTAMEELIADGTLGTLAEKYDLSELLLANQQ
ncbi:ABC transporter, substrate-binding protein, family 3 [uncultured Eubacteriales bacterium]|uniref:ABC transporter, substrate-binding protein, family 3 n=1 Tax=uncultured Eubacteriales bacterium TaxID=172733 RepID=A0A212KCS4_9FIRM|nr:ABC transporter, substrate-binding protein, family 3 [uncultured Eubacteriales bacterium]